MSINLLEYSVQHLPAFEPDNTVPVASQPLWELEVEAADTKLPSDVNDVVYFPFSNDDVATYYQQLAVRTETPEYKAATNRTALIVGEGALMSALSHIPEDTIVMIDYSPNMIRFMRTYVNALRTAHSASDFFAKLSAKIFTFKDGQEIYGSFGQSPTVNHWARAGQISPNTAVPPKHSNVTTWFQKREQAFAAAQALAQEKSIIPWYVDICDKEGMQEMGDQLRRHNANVTFANLTNVFTYGLADPYYTVENFNSFPFAEFAPILTTSILYPRFNDQDAELLREVSCHATGPFFGLQNLVNASKSRAMPLSERIYLQDFFN